MTRPAILARLHGVQQSGAGWIAFCPSHADREKRSLSVKLAEDGRTLLHCFVGCATEQVCAAVNMTLADLAPPARNGRRPNRREVTAYPYHDERGTLLYEVVRFEPKDFRPRRPDGQSGWTWNLTGVRRVVYRLPELAEQCRVVLVEGEKDADRLWSLGIPATTTQGGSQSWRDEYAEQIRAAGVEEIVACPDNDDAGRSYTQAAGAALTRLGIAVRVLALPGLPPKGDISDWLDAGQRADELLALVDAAPIFTEVAAPNDRSPGPELLREGLDLALAWPGGVRFVLTAIRDGREGVRGELTVTRAGRRLSWTSFSLPSAQARDALRKKLEGIDHDMPWGEYLEEAAWRFTEAVRQGEPLVTLTGTPTGSTRELVPRLLYEGEPTLLFGDGDTGKSLVGLALAVAVQSGAVLPFGLKPVRPVPVAYLDWETSRDTLETRLAMIAAGLGVDPPPILYKSMRRPLVDEAAALAAEFARRGIGFVVIDSKMFAVASGDGAAFHEPITNFYNALRLFAPAAALVLNHVTNADARTGGPARPFGGAFAFNGPRLIWEAKRDRDVTDATAIAFTCQKANNLARRPDPFGLRFHPGDGTITVYPFDLTDASPQTTVSAPLTWRLRVALAPGKKKAPMLAEELGAKLESVKRALQRGRGKLFVLLDGDEWGLAQP
jgi:hypothetical protein